MYYHRTYTEQQRIRAKVRVVPHQLRQLEFLSLGHKLRRHSETS
jgi:hypothetical protein